MLYSGLWAMKGRNNNIKLYKREDVDSSLLGGCGSCPPTIDS